MKKVTQYKCEFCGTLYAQESDCKACEKQHKVPVEIVRADFRAMKLCPGYPPYVLLRFSDGSERKYKREG